MAPDANQIAARTLIAATTSTPRPKVETGKQRVARAVISFHTLKRLRNKPDN
jgi:hypothetical protein